MGEGIPEGGIAIRVLDAEAAMAALVQAGATDGLDAALARAAEILLQRFGAELAVVYVVREGNRMFWAPGKGALTAEIVFPELQRFTDPVFARRLEEQGAGLAADLAAVQSRSPGEEAAFSRGLRSAMWAGFRDERDETIGFILLGRTPAGAFSEPDLRELKTLGGALARFARPAVLLEEQAAERRLLEEEAAIFAAIAEAETEDDLVAQVCDGVRRALGADLALLRLQSASDGIACLRSSPPDAVDAEDWAAARVAFGSGLNGPMTERSREAGAFTVGDLSESVSTPVEAWMRDRLGMRSLVAATRSSKWGGPGLGLCALRRAPGPWSEGQRTFVARLARVFAISVERLRRGATAIDHAAKLERQADLFATAADMLETLSTARDIESACSVISERLRTFFGADHVAFGIVDLKLQTRAILAFSSDVMVREEFSPLISGSDVEAYARTGSEGGAEFVSDLAELDHPDDAAATLYERGIRSLMRTPFPLSDGSLGIVTVGSKEGGRYGQADAARLLGLCHPVGAAIDRVRLLARMASTSAVLDTKTRILAALVPGATVESAGQVFAEETRRLFGAVHAVAALFAGGEVKIAGLATDVVESEATRQFRASEELYPGWHRAIGGGKPQMIADLGAVERTPAEDYLFQSGIACLMRAPIIGPDGGVRGVVTAGAPQAHWWDASALATFMELAQSLGLVFERAEFYEAAEERAAKVQALTRLLSTLNLQSPPEEVARLFARQVREYLSADGVMVYAFDHEAGQRVRVAVDAGGASPLSPERVSLEESSGYRGTLEHPQSQFSAAKPEEAPEWLRTAATAMGYGSAVCVRLDAAGESVGIITAGSVDPAGMGPKELEVLAAVAAPLGMVLERARATTSLRLQTQRTQAVLDILAALGPADSLELIANPVANALRTMYGADHCTVGVIEDGLVTLAGVDSTIIPWQKGDSVALELLWGGSQPAGSVLHVVADLTEETGLPEILRQTIDGGMRSSMRVLIGTPLDPLGIVTVGSRQPARYSEFDARQLGQIVQPLAVVARYFRGKREAAIRTERLEITNRILTRLSAGGTPEHLARVFLGECRALFDSPHALAVQFDQESNSGHVLAVDSDLPAVDELPTVLPLEEMQIARMLRQPTPQLVVDSREEPGLNVRHLHLTEAGAYSAIRAPLIVHDTVRGAVSFWGMGAGKFSAEDAELLGTLTRPLALALEKASALASLGESELKYRSLVAQADEMIFLFDTISLRILDANSFTSRALGYDAQELTHLTMDRLIDATAEEIATAVAAAVADGELHLTDVRFLRKDSSAFDIEAVASMVTFGGRQAVLVLARDVSERKALLRQVMQSQKMDSLGAMAGAVAHDFNNLLTTILGFAGLLKRSPNMDTEERENLALIEDAARRAADLTGRLLAFSRGGLVRFGKVDLRTVAEDTLKLTQPSIHTNLRVTRSLPGEPVIVEGDAGQLQQALTNIILNARDAMPESGSIDISLTTEDSIAVLAISDSGPGMDEETRTRIFEPFYTTKEPGSGTGLGMAITYGIIQGHHGDIAVRSEPGKGTQFTISLPLLDDGTQGLFTDAFNAGEGNLVLVVDDDAMVRRTTTATLAELGYNVVEAPGGSTAIEILRARPDRFSAVLLDLVMPGMTGSETFRALTAIRPDLPVVVCTGYAADSHIDTDVKRRIAGLVQKPFTAERLGRALVAAGALPTRASRI